MRIRHLVLPLLFAAAAAVAQQEATLRIDGLTQHHPARVLNAVVWLKPIGAPAPPFPGNHHYRLVQKNKLFSPHLLVVPVGATVMFPNEDPFFHNVFSLFDGRRFDLGLYEKGSSKGVTFSREGVSYIFCNIHPQMSAVVLSLTTPLYALAEADNRFHLHNVPAGDYEMHVWIEGANPSTLDHMTRRVRVGAAVTDLGSIHIDPSSLKSAGHKNKFGQDYEPEPKSNY